MQNLDTLVEVVFELRFKPAPLGITELLPGILYEKLKSLKLKPKLDVYPFHELPKDVLSLNQELAYLPYKRLSMEDENLYIQFAHYALFLNNPKPYLGWEKFRGFVEILIKTIGDCGFEYIPESIGLRYINLVPSHVKVNMQMEFGGWKNSNFRNIAVKVDLEEEDKNIILRFMHPARVITKTGVEEGTLVDITIYNPRPRGLEVENLGEMHDTIKHVFFNRLVCTGQKMP